MTSLKTIELKFLLKLLGCEDYRGKVTELSPSSKTSAADRDRICEALGAKGLIDYTSEIARFTISPPGRTLLTLDTTSLPVTPDELKVLRACKGAMTPGKLGKQVPASARQSLIASLADRGMLKISKNTIKEVWLSSQGKQFLLNEYDPVGNAPVATATMLGHYVRFLRTHANPLGKMQVPTVQPTSQSVDSSNPSSSLDDQAVLQQIKYLDRLVGSDNYLPIYHLREKLQPPLSNTALNEHLYSLQRDDLIELSSLHDQGTYTDEQMAAGILQNNGGSLFFITVL